jgi:hypothetical protein
MAASACGKPLARGMMVVQTQLAAGIVVADAVGNLRIVRSFV